MPLISNTHVIYSVCLAVRLHVVLHVRIWWWCCWRLQSWRDAMSVGKYLPTFQSTVVSLSLGQAVQEDFFTPKLKTLRSFTSGTTCSATQHHIPEDWYLQRYSCPCANHESILGSRHIAAPFLNVSNTWRHKWSASHPSHFDPKA
jgi:hypothetical protein